METFLARQPIFDRRQHVFGYELLYRSGLNNYYDAANDDSATASLLTSSFLSIGIDAITGGKVGFINFTDALLRSGTVLLFPKETLGIELSNSIPVDDEVFQICADLRKEGYRLILDDFDVDQPASPLLEIADIIKVDFLDDSKTGQMPASEITSRENVTCLAKRVETTELFDRAVDLGYDLFQGYFFAKPVIMSGKELCAHQVSYLSMLREINQPQLDFDRLETIIKRDVALSYKLLGYINSPFFGLPNTIRSIRHALGMLGLLKAKRWLSLLVLSSIGSDKTEELIVNCLIRAKFFELIAPKVGHEENAPELFMLGLFSMIDALLDAPMAEILESLPLSEHLKNALLGKPGRYSDVFQLLVNYERGDWDLVCAYLEKVSLQNVDLPKYFLEAINWSAEALPR